MIRRCTVFRAAVAAAFLSLSCKPTQSAAPQNPTATAAVDYRNPGGMWMPSQMTVHAQTLRELGLAYDPSALTQPTSFPLGAVVSLGGCSASFVSEQGLVVTNHHCVIGALQHNSTPEHNLLSHGFLATNRADERSAGPNQRVFVTTAMRDVTDKMVTGLDTIEDPKQRVGELAKRSRELEAGCEAERAAGTRCNVRSYFEGAEYWLAESLEIKDVRLVYAPHEGIGVFGGEVDNWRWPRHTGDFAFLRAYVGPDGKPAEYAANNVPYKPPHHLEIASAPLQPGDLVVVAGYPGRTNRLTTASEAREALEWKYPREIDRYGQLMAALEQLGEARPELAIKTASRMRRLANYHTNYKGMLEGLTKGGLVAQKGRLEADLQAWIEKDPERKRKWGTVLGDIAQVHAQALPQRDRDAATKDVVEAGSLLGLAIALVATIEGRDADSTDPTSRFETAHASSLRAYDPDVDRALLRVAIVRAAALPESSRPTEVLQAILGKNADNAGDAAAVDAALVSLFAKTKLGDQGFRSKLLRSGKKKTLTKQDPLLQIAAQLRPLAQAVNDRNERQAGMMAVLRPMYVKALREFLGKPIAPDANGTLRITYGTVRGYKPAPDAKEHAPFTTLAQMLEKNTGTAPFAAPPSIVDAARRDKGPYVDATLGDVPLDFLADLDITGGNSGSATLNAKGELVGLAFDGNYEAIASDWMFLPDITRSIHVDVRFILWVMDAVDGADHLLQELGVEPKLPSASVAAAPAAAAAG